MPDILTDLETLRQPPLPADSKKHRKMRPGRGWLHEIVRKPMDTRLTQKTELKPSNEIREKILAVVDEKHGAFWGEFYDALIPPHTVEEVRLALNSLVQDRTLRMKEDPTEHDWEYRRAR